MVTWIIGITSAAMVVGGLVYLKEMLWGNTRPNRVSWFLWGLPPVIGAVIAWQDGVEWRVWLPILAIGAGTILIFVASFLRRDGYWKLGPLDYVCGLFSLLAIAFWAINRDPFTATALAVAGDGLAALPTLAKSWKSPETETAVAYLSTGVASATGLLAIERGDFIEMAFPVYMACMNLTIAAVIYYRRRAPRP